MNASNITTYGATKFRFAQRRLSDCFDNLADGVYVSVVLQESLVRAFPRLVDPWCLLRL